MRAMLLAAGRGALGFQWFLLITPLLVLLSRKAPRAPVIFGIAGAVITFVSLPNLRYVYPALPLISIGLSWLLCELPAFLLPAAAIFTVVSVLLPFAPNSITPYRRGSCTQ